MIFLRRYLWLLAILGLLPLLVYTPSLRNGFVNWDDGLLIMNNPWIAGLTWVNIRHAFTSYDPELYIPLTLLSYQVNYAIAGLAPWIYHLTNLLLHIVNVLLLFVIALQLIGKKTAAFAAALLFAIHPLHTEAVAWAAARKDVLSAAFLFLALVSFLRYRITKKFGWYGLSIASFALGLLSKVSILTAPFALIGIDWLEGKISFRRSVRDALPYFGLSMIFGIVSLFGKIPQSTFVYDKILIGARAAAFLVQKLLFPWGLTVFYPYTKPISLMTPDILFSVIIVLAISIACVLAIRFSRWPLFAWIIFLLFLIPTFTNMAKGKNYMLDVYVTSDRYAYAASIGPLLLAGLAFDELILRWKWWGNGALACVTILFGILTFRQSLTWKDSEAMFRHAVDVSPNAYIAHQNLGTILGNRGDLEGALEEYKITLRIRHDGATYYNIGQILEHEGNIPLAIETYKKAVEVSPDRDAAARLDALTK